MIDVCEIIEQETHQSVTNETPLESLPLDSLEFLDLLLRLGEATGKSIPDEKIGSLQTVGDIARELS